MAWEARASEPMVPTIDGEWERKRRMMNRAWQIVLISGIADPRGYPPLYALMVLSHRLLRYAVPLPRRGWLARIAWAVWVKQQRYQAAPNPAAL